MRLSAPEVVELMAEAPTSALRGHRAKEKISDYCLGIGSDTNERIEVENVLPGPFASQHPTLVESQAHDA